MYGADVLLVMELCLLGAFIGVSEVLFFYRRLNRTWEDRVAQFGLGSLEKSASYLCSGLCLELLRVILNSEVSRFAQVTLYAELLSTVYFRNPHWRNLLRTENVRQLSEAWRQGKYEIALPLVPFCLLFHLPYLFETRAWYVLFRAVRKAIWAVVLPAENGMGEF